MPETIYEMAKANPELSTLASALEMTGLDDDLNGSGALTVLLQPMQPLPIFFLQTDLQILTLYP